MTDDELLQEMDVLAKRGGLEIPPDRKAMMIEGYKELAKMRTLLRQPRTAADEPASTYSLLTITRGL